MTTSTVSTAEPNRESPVYKGQFGEYTITEGDRQGVIIYRSALMAAALCFGVGATLVLQWSDYAFVPAVATGFYFAFCIALGVALATIHIYMAALHRSLQAFLAIGVIASIVLAIQSSEALILTVYQQPIMLLGIGFVFVALTGIFFKEAFCFNRFETKILTILVPFLLLGHMIGRLPIVAEQLLLAVWATLFFIFALRKLFQDIPADIGDKSVFEYLKQQKMQSTPS